MLLLLLLLSLCCFARFSAFESPPLEMPLCADQSEHGVATAALRQWQEQQRPRQRQPQQHQQANMYEETT